ncbi:MAG: DUF3658 domain-containing protein [Chitinophagaceae bacterium]
MLHLVFEPVGKEILQKSFELDMFVIGDIFALYNDYGIGTFGNIKSEFFREERKSFYKEIMQPISNVTPYDDLFDHDKNTIEKIEQLMNKNPEEQIWLWIAPNACNICGYYTVMPYLKKYIGRVFVLFLSNLPFFNKDKKIFYPKTLQEIPSQELLKVRKITRLISYSEWEVDQDEYTKLKEENTWLRIWEGNKKISSVPTDMLDKEIINFLPSSWIKMTKFLPLLVQELKHYTNEYFLAWRIFCLSQANKIACQGSLQKGWKDFELMK